MTSIQDLMRDAAAERDIARQHRDRAAIDILNLTRGHRAGEIVHLDDDTTIVETFGLRPSAPDQAWFAVVHKGERPSTYVATLPLALLYAAQIMAGGRPHDDDYVYAARVPEHHRRRGARAVNLPDGCRLAYTIFHEAWYASADPDRRPTINVSAASTHGDGVAWDFQIVEHQVGPAGQRIPALRVEIFDDAWPAFAQVPELFAALAAAGQPTLNDVTVLLDRLGAVDETARTSPYTVKDTP